MFYSIISPHLLNLLASAETVLAETGEQVALCPAYRNDTPVNGAQTA